jgi:hypothetical protein
MTICKLMGRKDELMKRFLREDSSPSSALSKSVRSLQRALEKAGPRPHAEPRTCLKAHESATAGWTVGDVIDVALETMPRQLSEAELWKYNVAELEYDSLVGSLCLAGNDILTIANPVGMTKFEDDHRYGHQYV